METYLIVADRDLNTREAVEALNGVEFTYAAEAVTKVKRAAVYSVKGFLNALNDGFVDPSSYYVAQVKAHRISK